MHFPSLPHLLTLTLLTLSSANGAATTTTTTTTAAAGNLTSTNGIGSTPQQRHYISASQAQKVIAAAEKSAASIDIPQNIAVVDPSGLLVAFLRMDNAYPGSVDISMKKARTSVLFNGLTSAGLYAAAQPGGDLYGMFFSLGFFFSWFVFTVGGCCVFFLLAWWWFLARKKKIAGVLTNGRKNRHRRDEWRPRGVWRWAASLHEWTFDWSGGR